MTKLTANTHAYEFELMPNVIVQYDVNSSNRVDGHEIVMKFSNLTEMKDLVKKLDSEHHDLTIYTACLEHFVNKVF